MGRRKRGKNRAKTAVKAPYSRPVLKNGLDRREAAAYLASKGITIAVQTLANMASNNNAGRGPAFTRIGWRSVSYSKADLDAWAKQYVVRIE